MDAELDLNRLAELQQLLGKRVPEIVATLIEEISAALDAIATALHAGDLDAAALAAHAARNSALMIDAQPLLGPLAELETGARHRDPASARTAHTQVTASWPRLRDHLERAAAEHG